MTRFVFAFTRAYRLAALPFGVTPRTAWAAVDEGRLLVHFGPWRLRTSVDNIARAGITGGFAFVKTAGPAHLSLADRGVTFATNGERAVCLEFHDPVTAIDPMGLITHPNATLTPSDPQAFLAALGGDLPEAG